MLIITAFTSIRCFLLMCNYVHQNKIGPLTPQNSVHLLKEKRKTFASIDSALQNLHLCNELSSSCMAPLSCLTIDP